MKIQKMEDNRERRGTILKRGCEMDENKGKKGHMIE